MGFFVLLLRLGLPSQPSARSNASRRRTDDLVQPEFPVDCFDLRRLDQFAMRNAHRMQRALELLLPEGQEAVQFGKFGAQIVVLPDIGLEQPAMIGAPV
jgi:hypothetical protein